jgi:hypothetical protein
MKKKSPSRSAFFSPRVLIVLFLCAVTASSILTLPVLAFLRPQEQVNSSQRTLSFEERVSYQKAIEEVYWRHRIWPEERPDPKPSLDAVISQAQLEKKVTDYLRNSQALEDYWQRPITADQLQAEMDRMAKNTKQPELLRELFEALGNDPFVIAECVARPVLAERLLTSWYSYDQRFHGKLKERAAADLQAHPTVEQMKQTGGKYSEIEFVKSDSVEGRDVSDAGNGVKLKSRAWDEMVQKLTATFDRPGIAKALNFGLPLRELGIAAFKSAGMPARSKDAAADTYEGLPTRKLSALQEDETHYYAAAVIEKRANRLKLASVSWLKEPLESWEERVENAAPKAILTTGTYTLPKISDQTGGCTDDTWAASALNLPDERDSHTAVWTGNEMIIWGGGFGYPFTAYNSGGRYTPSTGAWTATSTANAPSPRGWHTAVWTGNEMIVWGGSQGLGSAFNTGGDTILTPIRGQLPPRSMRLPRGVAIMPSGPVRK